jgi:polynucleotide 5'-kinase involved in rRNA processing
MEPTIIVVVGPKHSGKSTYCQNAVDSILMDVDVGQTLHLPGTLSLFQNRENSLREVHSLFYGDNSPSIDPEMFLMNVTLLMNVYKRQFPTERLIVNTFGWTRGLGYDLIVQMIRIINPDLVVNMGDLQLSDALLQDIPNLEIKLLAPIENPDLSLKKDLQDNKLLDYFSNCSYYKVDWETVHIKFLFNNVPYHQALYALNGVLVALCHYI